MVVPFKFNMDIQKIKEELIKIITITVFKYKLRSYIDNKILDP